MTNSSEMQIKKFQFCAALAASSLQSVMGDSHPDPHGVALEIGGAEVGHGHGHSHHANKVRTDCNLLIFYLFSCQILVLSNVLLDTFGWVLFSETTVFLQFNTIFVINDLS